VQHTKVTAEALRQESWEMTEKQDIVVSQLLAYLTETGLELLGEREIEYGRQFKISNGIGTCSVNVYTSGKVIVGGKKTALRQQMEEWKNLQAQTLVEEGDEDAAQNRATKFIVAQAKIEKIKSLIKALPCEITWREEDPTGAQVYQAEIRTDGDKVVITQYHTGTLMVQGRTSALFDSVCDRLDQKLSQSVADRATRYIPEGNRDAALGVMNQPHAETKALDWLIEKMGQNTYEFLYPHDRETLLSGAALLQAVRTIGLKLPDYSVLVMPFARAYEGFLVKLFIHIGLADMTEIERSVRAVQVGRWLDELAELIADPYRHGHIADALKTAWTGSRHLTLHSNHVRQTKMSTLDEANQEICGVIMRAVKHGFTNCVERPITLKQKDGKQDDDSSSQTEGETALKGAQPSKQEVKVEGIDEERLSERLEDAGYTVEHIENLTDATKWRVITENWKVFCPREPGDMIVVRGTGREDFLAWLHGEEDARVQPVAPSLAPIKAHIGVDEAGKGDYFGPLTVAAVYVTAESAHELIRWGVRDSKTISDAVIAELALEIRERCPNVVHVLMPPEYNAAYRHHKNLNHLLAEAHAKAIEALSEQTGCRQVVSDRFAAPHVLESALAERGVSVDLEQRPNGESDVAVAAASILARESFVAAIEDFRVKAEMDIPLGSSSPQVVEIGQAIVRRWGPAALERIAKLNFKTTEQILGRRR
jgi:ribonuclease HIII